MIVSRASLNRIPNSRYRLYLTLSLFSWDDLKELPRLCLRREVTEDQPMSASYPGPCLWEAMTVKVAVLVGQKIQ